MSSSGRVGAVESLSRFPVKSFQGESLQEVEVTINGLVGDRAFAVIDKETGKVASAKSLKLFTGLMNYRAEFVSPPRVGETLPAVRITHPDGLSTSSDDPDVHRILSEAFGREVELSQAVPKDLPRSRCTSRTWRAGKSRDR